MLSEFKKFVARGNVLDLAVGIVIGAAFVAIVNSFVNDILMPPISLLMGGIDFTNLYIVLRGAAGPTLKAAKDSGAVTISYGNFIQQVVNFLIIAFAVFLLVQQANKLKGEPKPAAPTTKPCPFCITEIPIMAKRCPNCTSQLAESTIQQ
jgi:large conductance mechanosensitive channel